MVQQRRTRPLSSTTVVAGQPGQSKLNSRWKVTKPSPPAHTKYRAPSQVSSQSCTGARIAAQPTAQQPLAHLPELLDARGPDIKGKRARESSVETARKKSRATELAPTVNNVGFQSALVFKKSEANKMGSPTLFGRVDDISFDELAACSSPTTKTLATPGCQESLQAGTPSFTPSPAWGSPSFLAEIDRAQNEYLARRLFDLKATNSGGKPSITAHFDGIQALTHSENFSSSDGILTAFADEPNAVRSTISCVKKDLETSESHTLYSLGSQVSGASVVNIPLSNSIPHAPQEDLNTNLDDPLLLSHQEYGIPDNIVQAFAANGLTSFYAWQADCLKSHAGILAGTKNLLFSAPTSAGKSLVADILMLKKVIRTKRKAIMIVPFVAMASEKTREMQKIFAGESLNIVGYYSDVGASTFDDVDIAYCTPEKANSLVNRLMEEGNIQDLGIVVVDELHMAGDASRGYLLELLLTKLRYIMKDDLQVVGMSATLPNLATFAKWLDAELYVTDYRPVPLTEYIKLKTMVYNEKGEPLRSVGKDQPRAAMQPLDTDLLVPLVQEVIDEGGSVLIFCGTKKRCVSVGKLLAAHLACQHDEDITAQRDQILRELERMPGNPHKEFLHLIKKGVAYHHADLTTEERDIIQEGFRAGTIKVIACTSTLAMGVNLPARRVIFRTVKDGLGNLLKASDYQQMKGRAGRKGLDTYGECILMCENDADFRHATSLTNAKVEPVSSCLLEDLKGIKRAFLEVIVAEVATTEHDLKAYSHFTLLLAQQEKDETSILEHLRETVQYLRKNKFIEESSPAKYKATKLGCATVCSSMAPEEALVVFRQLGRALHNFALHDDLHIVYHVTPPYAKEITVSWEQYSNIFSNLDNDRKIIANLIGITDREIYMCCSARGFLGPLERRDIYTRFYYALILNNLVQEKPLEEIMRWFPHATRGQLQNLQTQAGRFAGMTKIFCERLGWTRMELIVSDFQDRLNFGVSADLLELIKIPDIGASRARILWKEGLKNVTDLACALPEQIFQILRRATPFSDSSSDANMQKRILYRAAHTINEGARKIVEAQIREAAVEAERKRSLLAKVRDLRSPSSTNSKQLKVSASISKSSTPRQGFRTAGAASPETPCPPLFNHPGRQVKENNLPKIAASASIPLLAEPPLGGWSTKATSAKDEPTLEYQIIDVTKGKELFEEFMKQWSAQPEYVWNTCSKPSDAGRRLMGLAICWQSNRVYFLNVQGKCFDWERIGKVFGMKSKKICYDAKGQLALLLRNGVMPASSFLDPKIAAWLLEPDLPERNLKKCFESMFPRHRFNDNGSIEYQCCLGAWQTRKVMREIHQRLAGLGLDRHFEDVEMQTLPLLARMEHVGVGFVYGDFRVYWDLFKRKLNELELEAYRVADYIFSLTNPAHVAQVLYDVLQLPYEQVIADTNLGVEDNKKRQAKLHVHRRTCKEVLLKLLKYHHLPGVIMEHRRISKLVSTHLVPLQEARVMSPDFNMGRIHCTLQTHTATGRITATDPNLQNVPHPKGPLGESGLDIDSANLRNAFQAAEAMVLISADYSQVELRIIANLSEDDNLMHAIKSGGDFFRKIASQVLNKAAECVTDAERAKAKGLTYGVLYGRGAKSLAEELKVSIAEADVFLRGFDATYPAVSAWKKRIVQECHETGYVTTMLGRRRYLSGIHSKNMTERLHAERQAINTTVQGSAADLVKVAMIHIDKAFRNKWGTWMGNSGMDARKMPHLLLQIHDELLFEVPAELVDEVKPMIIDAMSHTVKMDVPLPVRLKMGTQWGSLQ